MSLRFEWDVNKATANETKHNVSFAEAATVFRDPIAVIFDDEAHSNEEVENLSLDTPIGTICF